MVTLGARLRVEQTKPAQGRTRLVVACRPENQQQHDDKVEHKKRRFQSLTWLPRGRSETMGFSEKKKQKTFACSGCGLSGSSERQFAKVFWFFFSKKNGFPLPSWPHYFTNGLTL
jgi:hypothetical protein